jgi:hypothetical protein
MSSTSLNAAFAAFLLSLLTLSQAAHAAEAGDFAAGSRVEARIGWKWDSCTSIGERRPTGGYLLRCDSIPNQESVFAASDVRAMQGPDRGAVQPQRPVAQAVRGAQLQAVASAPFAIPPRVGVYGCMNQDAMEVVGLQFGILDANSYSTFDGGRGHYTYSAVAGLLTFTSGPFAGLRRTRETERTFRIVDEHGARTAFLCPWTPKDPRKVHW